MAFNYSPKIVTNGLVLCLDAANPKSYPGSGTAWNDISRGGNNGTLVNGPTFSSANGGSIDFDGSNDWGQVPGLTLSTVAYTKIAWFNPDTATANIISGGSGDGQHAFWMASTNFLNAGHNGAWNTVQYTGQSLPGRWWCGAVTFNTSTGWVLYLNGDIVDTDPSTVTFTGGTAVRIAAYNDASSLFNGKIAIAQIYNRALTQQEVLQNYNATKGRFGL